LGLGIMGSRMAANLVRAGFEVVVWNRTIERARELAEAHDVGVASSPAEAAREADFAITMLGDGPDVAAVLFGEDGAAAALAEGSLVIDSTTTAPTAATEAAERLAGSGIAFIDAPVSGSRPKAEDGTLTIMVGASPEDFDRASAVLEAMGELIVHVGPVGHGQMAKLIMNTLAAVNAAAVAEGLTLGRRAGLDLESLVKVVGAGAGASKMLELKNAPMREHDFEPLFKLDHMLKDVRHCLAAARSLGSPLPLGEQAERLYSAAASNGLGQGDFAAVVTIAEQAAGIEGPASGD